MIILTKLNNQKILINSIQIEAVELIPESKIVMMNGKYYLVKESADEIIEKCIAYQAKIGACASKMGQEKDGRC